MSFLERQPENECRYEYLSPSELRERLASKAVLYQPIGSLEWHNEHLPLGTDTFHALALAARLAGQVGGVVLPGFFWNTGDCHDCDVTAHMPEDLYRPTLKSICLSLAPIPAKVLVLINGHGGGFQNESPYVIADELNADASYPIRVVVGDPYAPDVPTKNCIDHADQGETSFSLQLIPQLVRMDRELVPDLFTHKMPFVEKGQPSAEIGQVLWDAYCADVTAIIEAAYHN